MKQAARQLAVGATWALTAIVASFAIGAAINACYAALARDIPEPAWLEKLLAPEATPEELVPRVLLFVFLSVVTTPLFEEFVFRELLQGWLMRRMRARSAVMVTALAFAAVHGSVHDFVPLLCVSVCFSMARIKGGGLVAPVAAHALYNMVALMATLVIHAAG